ncbi:MAG: hypothetical protein WCY24_00500 [Lutispora sp.]
MSNSNTYKILLESRGNKFCIYYKNATIYCKTIDFDGMAKEIILIDSVYENFLYSKSQEDNIYLLFQGRNKNFLLFTYDGEGWHMEELLLRKNFSNIIPLGLFILMDGMHIIYAKKLPIENYYDLFQLKKEKDEWEKTFICEIYSKKIESSLDIKATGYDMVHIVSTFYDGEASSLNYYNYSINNSKWLNIPIVNLNHNNIYIKVLIHENKLNVFCYNIDNSTLNLFYFTKHLSKDSSFSLIDIIKLSQVPKGLDLVMELNDDILKISYMGTDHYWENYYNISQKKWEKTNQISLNEFPNLHYAKIIYDNFNLNIEEKEAICLISDKLKVSLPEIKSDYDTEAVTEAANLDSRSAALILGQINILSEKIEDLNKKLNKSKEKDFYKEPLPMKEDKCQDTHNTHPQPLRESNFKERFMNRKPTSIKLESSTLLSKEIKNAGITFPQFSNMEKEEKLSVIAEEKKEEIEVVNENQGTKHKSIIRSISEWFK